MHDEVPAHVWMNTLAFFSV